MSSVSLHYAGSTHPSVDSIAGYARRITHSPRLAMDILIDDHCDLKVYSTFDPIRGKVAITAPHNVRFDEVRITFEGTTKTYVEDLSPSASRSRTTAVHKFLKLIMPRRPSDYPQPRIAEAGRTYNFDFNFAVPQQLLPRACSHRCSSPHLQDAHLQVPPSIGEREMSGLDDLAPDMTKVTYAVKVQVIQNRDRDSKDVVLVEGLKKLRVVPAVQEAPPLSLGEGFEDYVVSKTKPLRKGMFSGKLGHITIAAAQPSALVLSAPAQGSTTLPTTMATVKLRFDPHDAASNPPRLGGLTTKIKSTTFYSARPAGILPSHFNMVSEYERTRAVSDTSTPLSSRCVESVAWKRHEPNQIANRRNSDSSTSSLDFSDSALPSDQKPGNPFYTASVLVPITLPANKTWIPSFHSCIVSRVYAIDLSLSVHTPGPGVPASSVVLHVPVQIAANSNQAERAELTAAEAAAELADANAFMQPRVLEVPSEEHVGNSILVAAAAPTPVGAPELPPSYEDFISQPTPVVEPGRC